MKRRVSRDLDNNKDKKEPNSATTNDAKIAAETLAKLARERLRIVEFFSPNTQEHIGRMKWSSPVQNLISEYEEREFSCILHPEIKGNLTYIEAHIMMDSEHKTFILKAINDSIKELESKNIPEDVMITALKKKGFALPDFRAVAMVKTAEDIDYGTKPLPEILKQARFVKDDGSKQPFKPESLGGLMLIPPDNWKVDELVINGKKLLRLSPVDYEDVELVITAQDPDPELRGDPASIYRMFKELLGELRVNFGKGNYRFSHTSNVTLASKSIRGARVICTTPNERMLVIGCQGAKNEQELPRLFFIKYEAPIKYFTEYLSVVEDILNTVHWSDDDSQ